MSAGAIIEREVALPLADVPPGTSVAVKAFGTTVAIFNVEGKLFAVGNYCPHHGGPLCHSHVSGANLPSQPYKYRYGREGRVLTCPWHGWQFDLESGRTMFDSSSRVKVYEVHVESGVIMLTRQRRREGSR